MEKKESFFLFNFYEAKKKRQIKHKKKLPSVERKKKVNKLFICGQNVGQWQKKHSHTHLAL